MNKGQELWKRATKVIPGGNGLLSKRPDRYAPDIWPAYFSKAKGVKVWDLDGNEYTDMAQMGIGTAILGYSDDDVDKKVKAAIDSGINCTLNAPEEVLLAEKLIEHNSFAGGVKFAKTGAEAMAIAVRIARAFTGKDTVAFSGYHGWSDWYLATNLKGENNLSDHLLPGLEPKGVPQGLAGSVRPFRYNNIEELYKVVDDKVGAIVIEGARYDFPNKDFLEAIQKIAKEKNILIVVDEITSGWRLIDGGVYKLNGLQPDIVVYGKGIGNGYPISAVVGKAKVMDTAQDTFISSTFWTERVGFVAALATIEKFVENKVWEHLNRIGDKIGKGWEALGKKHGLELKVTDMKPLITFKMNYGDLNGKLLTYFIQEMLSRGYLAASSIYVSYAHNEEIVESYMEAVDEVFGLMKEAIDKNNIDDVLKTAPRDDGFKRLN